MPHAEALRIRDDVAFFQAVQAVLAKRVPGVAWADQAVSTPVTTAEITRASPTKE